MRQHIFIVSIVVSCFCTAVAQQNSQWEVLNEGEGNYNTFDFVNDDIGWMCGIWRGDVSILKTENGGETWYPLTIEGNFSIEMIDFVNEYVGWAVGNEYVGEWGTPIGNILKTMDGGLTWSVQKTTSEGLSLLSIQALNDSIAYIIGTQNQYDYYNESGVILKTSDGGTNWLDISPQNSHHRRYEICHFFNSQIGLVTGCLHDSNMTYQQGIILVTDDGGIRWEETLIPEFERIEAVQFIDDSTGFFLSKNIVQDSSSLYKTTDRLMSWSLIDQDHNITTFFYLDRDLACAIAGTSMLKSTDGGKTWEKKLDFGNLRLNKLYFWNEVGYGFCYVGIYTFGVGNLGFGTLLKSVDQGEHWTFKKIGYPFQDVCFVDKDRGFAAGGSLYIHLVGYGDMFVTDDGGKTWKLNFFNTDQKIESCFFVNSTIGFVLSRVIEGSSSHIYKTTDSGKSWQNILNAPVDRLYFEGLDICFANEQIGWAVGEGRNLYNRGATIIATSDGGKSWESNWFKKSASAEQRFFLRKIHFLNENTGWAVGDGGLMVKYTTADQWQLQSSVTDLPLTDVFFSDEQYGWIAGGYKNLVDGNYRFILLRTKNGGKSWQEVPDICYQINDMYFADSLHGWTVGSDTSNQGIILETFDGGDNWNIVVENLSAPLNAAHFKDSIVWAVGDNGLVLRTEHVTTWVDQNTRKIYPDEYCLDQNYPNPFNPLTTISYTVGAIRESPLQQVSLSIYNILGQKVATLVNKKQPLGSYQVEWDASGFASGVYLYRLETSDGYTQSKKLLLLK